MALAPGTTLAHFEIVGKLGAGGMGEVYRARDTKLGRDVAIKVLPEDFAADAERLDRFEREAKVLASLNHPHIGALFDFHVENDVRFLVMELVEGESLQARLERGPVPLRDALPMFIQIAAALDAAHAKDIIHRDLKPGNIQLKPDGTVKVLDFGLARPLTATRPRAISPTDPTLQHDPNRVTTDGSILGTPSYMSPEQARGKDVDKRSDIWAYGCCLFECLTGRSPFSGDTLPDTLAAVLQQEPDWSRLPTDVPREVRALLRRCLEKRTGRRLSSAGDIAATLEELADDLKQEARRPTQTSLPPAPGRTRRSGWLGPVSAGILVAIAGIAAGLVLASRNPRGEPDSLRPAITSLAVLPLENLMNDPEQDYFVDGMTEAITAELSKISSLKVISRTSTTRYKDTDLSMPEIASELGVQGLVEGSVLRDGDDVRITVQLIDGPDDRHLWAQSYTNTVTSVLKLQAEVALAIAGEIRAEVQLEERERIADKGDVNPEALDAYLRGRLKTTSRAPEDLKEALELFRRATEIDETYAAAYSGMADTYALLAVYRLADPGECFVNGEAAARRALALDPTLAEAHASLGSFQLNSAGDWAGARRSNLRALSLDPNYFNAHLWYGNRFLYCGEYKEARAELERAVELDPRSPIAATVLAALAYVEGDAEQSIHEFEAVLSRWPDFQPVFRTYVWPLIAVRRYDDALDAAKKLAALRNNDAYARDLLAAVLVRIGREDEARSMVEASPDNAGEGWLLYHGSSGDIDALKATVRKYMSEHVYTPSLFGGLGVAETLYDDDRFWELIEELKYPRLPPEHALYARQQDYLTRKAAAKMLAEQGLAGRVTVKSLAVLPFENVSGDAGKEYFVDGMTGALTSELSKISSLKVIGRASAMHYKRTDMPPREIAAELGVDGLITGSALQLGNEVKITAELMHADTQTTLWSNEYTNTLENVLKLHSDVALDIAEAIQATLTKEERDRYARAQGVNAAAYDLYLQGRELMLARTEDALRSALDLFKRATAVDPTFSQAYAGQADCYILLCFYNFVRFEDAQEPALELARRAVALNEDSSEAHASLGNVLLRIVGNWDEAEREFRRALELNPGSEYVRQWYGGGLMMVGRNEEGIAQLKQAEELNPRAAIYPANLSEAYMRIGDFDTAHRTLERALKLDANLPYAILLMGRLLWFEGRIEEALPWAQRLNNNTAAEALIALLKDADGDPEPARALLARMEAESDDGKMTPRREMVVLCNAAGDVDRALYWLPRIQGMDMVASKTVPEYEPLMDDPRFWDYVETLHLPPLPPSHPYYEKEQAYLIRKKAEELIQERGLVPRGTVPAED